MVSEMCVKVWGACIQALQHSGSILCVAFCRHSCWHDTWTPPGRLLPPPAASCRPLLSVVPHLLPAALHAISSILITEKYLRSLKILALLLRTMALKKNFRFSIIMTKQVLVRVRCWLETTTSSVDTVYCAQVRPSSCSTANVDSAPAHVICIVSSLHTAQLCWLPGTHTLTRVLAFTQIAHILG